MQTTGVCTRHTWGESTRGRLTIDAIETPLCNKSSDFHSKSCNRNGVRSKKRELGAPAAAADGDEGANVGVCGLDAGEGRESTADVFRRDGEGEVGVGIDVLGSCLVSWNLGRREGVDQRGDCRLCLPLGRIRVSVRREGMGKWGVPEEGVIDVGDAFEIH